jgi:hypothetical protein
MLRGVKAHKCNRPNEQRKGKAEDQGKEYMRGNKEEEQRSMSRLRVMIEKVYADASRF